MNTFKIIHGDCFQEMPKLKAGSFDLILTDPPYGTIKGLKVNSWKNTKTDWDIALDQTCELTFLLIHLSLEFKEKTNINVKEIKKRLNPERLKLFEIQQPTEYLEKHFG